MDSLSFYISPRIKWCSLCQMQHRDYMTDCVWVVRPHWTEEDAKNAFKLRMTPAQYEIHTGRKAGTERRTEPGC